MTWTSFDRFARYSGVAAAIDSAFGPTDSIVDVGDGSGYLRGFSGRTVVSVDLEPSDDALPHATLVKGSGTHLPFRDGEFDVAVSCDALEHVPTDLRPAFLAELARVGRRGVVVAAPFDTHGVAGCELVVERYALLATGQPQEQLQEHRTHGLPNLETTARALEDHGFDVAISGNGNLQDWIVLMLLKHQLEGREALQPLADSIDTFYNTALAHRSDIAPFYRHVVLATKDGAPTFPPSRATPAGMNDETIMPLLSAIASTTFGEVGRQDMQPGLIAKDDRLDLLDERVANLELGLNQAISATQVMLDRLAVLRCESEQALATARNPFMGAARRLAHRLRGAGGRTT